MHTEVRERGLPDGSVYAGVFPDVAEGDYTLLEVAGHLRRDVTIRSGCVTEVHLFASSRSRHPRGTRSDSSNEPVAAPSKSC